MSIEESLEDRIKSCLADMEKLGITKDEYGTKQYDPNIVIATMSLESALLNLRLYAMKVA